MADDREEVAGADSTANYEPVVKLQEVEVDSGERDEDTIYVEKAALYRFGSDTNEWKERGKGDVKLLKHKQTGKVRVILRQTKTLKVRMNHQVHPLIELKPNAGSDRSWTWTTTDFSDEVPTVQTFAIRFKNSDVAGEFKKAYDEARKVNNGAGGNEAKEAESSVWCNILKGRDLEGLGEPEIRKLWNVYDKDKSGTIDKKELESLLLGLLEAIVKALAVPLTDEVVKAIKDSVPELATKALKQLDKNGDGKLQWAEFVKLDEVQLGL